MYKCLNCKSLCERPLIRKDDFDGDLYRNCPVCGGSVESPAEKCSLCGGGLFREDRAYEVGADIYCKNCVNEVVI